MSDLITTGTSDYAVGGIDSATVLVSNVSPISAKHPNGLASGVVQIETILGSGTSLKGTKADLVARLAVALDSSGKLNLADVNALNGPLLVSKGGTGQSTAPDQRYHIGNGSGFDLLTPHGFIYAGPTSIASGSTNLFNGVVTISSPVTMGGINFYTDFTLSSATTITLTTGCHRLVIIASNSITINGTITGAGKGASGGAGGGNGVNGTAGKDGFSQDAGNGGANNGATTAGGAGGNRLVHGVLQTVTGTTTGLSIADPYSIMGGSGGGGGGGSAGGNGGNGGAGGGSIILVAPNIIIGPTATLITSGSTGSPGAGTAGGGGGGGAGNIYMFCRLFTDSGGIYTLSGGSGGSGAGGGANGGAGTVGVKQILLYGNT